MKSYYFTFFNFIEILQTYLGGFGGSTSAFVKGLYTLSFGYKTLDMFND